MANIFKIEKTTVEGVPLFKNDELVGHYSNYLKALNAAADLGASTVDVYAKHQTDPNSETRFNAVLDNGQWVKNN